MVKPVVGARLKLTAEAYWLVPSNVRALLELVEGPAFNDDATIVNRMRIDNNFFMIFLITNGRWQITNES